MLSTNQQLHLLIIEDNSGDFILIEDYLTEEFNDPVIHAARTYSQAEEILNSKIKIDVVLLDLSLPDLDGEELVNKVVAFAENIPVIVLTGFSNKEFGFKTLSLGISDYLLKDELNAPQLFKSICYSIERKRIELKLKESEEKYRNLFQLSPIPMWTYDLKTLKFLHVNDSAINHYGYTREEFLNMTLKDIRPPEDIPVLEGEITSFKKTKVFYRNVVRHRRKNGSIINVNINSNVIDFDGKDASLVLANDVTEKLNAENFLKNSEQRFKALVQDGSDLIAILDVNANYKYVSPTSETILQIKADEFIGKNAFDYIHEEDKDRVYSYFSLLGTVKRIIIGPFRFKDGKNNWRWVETTITDMLNDPAVGGIVANSKDITERINYINAIEKQNTRLKEISWIQSHLVRAPLARIMGLADLLINDHKGGEIGKDEVLNNILKSSHELDTLIRDIVKKAEDVKNL